jgi:hypothetical protein
MFNLEYTKKEKERTKTQTQTHYSVAKKKRKKERQKNCERKILPKKQSAAATRI